MDKPGIVPAERERVEKEAPTPPGRNPAPSGHPIGVCKQTGSSCPYFLIREFEMVYMGVKLLFFNFQVKHDRSND